MSLTASYRLNEFIAESVIGYQLKTLVRSNCKGIVVSRDMGDGKGDTVALIPDYSGNLMAAMDLLKWLCREGKWNTEVGMKFDNGKNTICFATATQIREGQSVNHRHMSLSETIPLAVCKLVLNVTGKKYEPDPQAA